MAKIHVVTDSGSDLPQAIREQFNIGVVPLSVQFGDEIYRDGIDMHVDEFYKRLTEGSILPSTCQPSPAEFLRVYKEIAEPGDTIISVHLSSKLSGTYQSAVLASTMLPDVEVKVIDTLCASGGIGMVAVAVAEALSNGATKEEAIAIGEKASQELDVYFVVDTLEYLKKNGRIGKAQALVGTLLNIKPILTLQEGMVAPFEKIRGKGKALKRMRELLQAYVEKYPGKPLRLGITHSDCLDEAEKLTASLKEEFPIHDLMIGPIGPTIGVHVGPGTIALFFYPVA